MENKTAVSGFHHIALKCCDIEKSLAMYTSLGLKEVLRWGEGDRLIVMLALPDGGRIELFANGSAEFLMAALSKPLDSLYASNSTSRILSALSG